MRHRRVRPAFLDPTDGAAAAALLSVLEAAVERNTRFGSAEANAAAARRFGLNVDVLQALISLIQKEGTDPNIIRKIEEIEE